MARQIAMYLCRELTGLSLPKIGAQFGNRDHTTVMYADRKINQLLAERRAVFNQVSELTNRVKCRPASAERLDAAHVPVDDRGHRPMSELHGEDLGTPVRRGRERRVSVHTRPPEHQPGRPHPLCTTITEPDLHGRRSPQFPPCL